MRHAMARLLEKAKTAQSRINEVKEMTRDQRERALCRIYAKEGALKMQALESAMSKVDAADGNSLDTASAAAKEVLEKTRDYLSERCTEVGRFGCRDDSSVAQVKELKRLQKQATLAEEKLLSLRSDLETRRIKSAASRSTEEPPRKAQKK